MFQRIFKFIKENYKKDLDIKIKYIETHKIKETLNKIKEQEIKDFVTIQLLTGLRIGELLALTPKDVNKKEKTIKITKTKQKNRRNNINKNTNKQQNNRNK